MVLIPQEMTESCSGAGSGTYFSGCAPLASAMCPEAVDAGLQLPLPDPSRWWTVVRRLWEQPGPRALESVIQGLALCEKNRVFSTNMICKLLVR